MPLSPEKLQKLLRSGDIDALTRFFRQASEPERRTVAPAVVEWCERLNLNWRAQFSEKAAREVAKSGAIRNWNELMPGANAAALACASLADLKALGGFGEVPPEASAAILGDRRPKWSDDYAELLCEGELRHWGGNWKQVRALVRAGVCRPPKHDNYALACLNEIWPRYDASKPQPKLVDLLLAERDWLEHAFWRLFEVDGTGEVSLANCEKYGRSEDTWTAALIELSQRGILPRDRLLDASLAALARDFIQFRAGWFSRFHEALSPTPAERVARMDVYLRLLASSIPPTVAFAVNAVAIADEAAPLPAARLLGAIPPALAARGKAVVKSALQLLDKLAKREPAARRQVCLAAIPALLNEAAEAQKAVFDLLDRHGDKQDDELRAKLQELTAAVAASLKPRLAAWLGQRDPGAKIQPSPAAQAGSPPPISRLDPARAIQPITDLDDLILAASAVLEEPANPMDIERVLDGISRLGDWRPNDFERRTGPLRKRALKKRDDQRSGLGTHPVLERALAMLMLSWIEDQDGFTEKPEKLACGQNHFAFLFRRLQALGRQTRQRKALPLLSAPTHAGSWIEPVVLVDRWLSWQQAGATPDLHEQVLALLRLAPEARAAALPLAKTIAGEPGQALRAALGEPQAIGPNAALWLAALRSRQPFGDLPEFEKAHGGLGPDAGVAARYSWGLADSKWGGPALKVRTEPTPPRNPDEALLPVLFHGQWHASEENEKHLLRWGTLLWPANREALFARAAERLEISVHYADVMDRDFCAYLEPLAEPHTELRPMACLALALGLAAQDNALRGHAQDGLIAATTEGRLDTVELGATMACLLDTGNNKFARWAKALREVGRVSSRHASIAADLLQLVLHGDPLKAPRDLNALLELLLELLSETGRRLTDAKARSYLSSLSTGGKTAKLIKHLMPKETR